MINMDKIKAGDKVMALCGLVHRDNENISIASGVLYFVEDVYCHPINPYAPGVKLLGIEEYFPYSVFKKLTPRSERIQG